MKKTKTIQRIISVIMAFSMMFAVVGCESNESSTDKRKTSKTSSSSSSPTDSSNASNEDSSSQLTRKVNSYREEPAIGIDFNIKGKETGDNDEINPLFLLEGDTTVKDEIKLGKYKFVWSDEFDGNSLNSDLWSKRITTGASDVYYSMDCITAGNGVMKSISTRYYDPSNPGVKWKTAPSITTANSMCFQYGYLEMRAKLPFKQGAWPSFWLLSNGTLFDQKYDSKKTVGVDFNVEVDIFEIINNLDTCAPNLHKWYTQGPLSGQHFYMDGKEGLKTPYRFQDINNLSDEYHIYGFEWTPDEMSMYVDGKKYNTFRLDYDFGLNQTDSKSGFSQYLYIILGVGTLYTPGFKATGSGIRLDDGSEPSDMPFEYAVDWIRLYQEPGVGGLMTVK